MSFLLDTNVVSEQSRPRPSAAVTRWLEATDNAHFLSVVTLGEVTRGLELVDDQPRKAKIAAFLQILIARFSERVVSGALTAPFCR